MSHYQQTLNLLRAKREELSGLKLRRDEAEQKNDVATAADIAYYTIPEVAAHINRLEEELSQLPEPVEANVTISEDRTRRGHFEDDKLRALQPRNMITTPSDTERVSLGETRPRRVKLSRHEKDDRRKRTPSRNQALKAETSESDDMDTVPMRPHRRGSSTSSQTSPAQHEGVTRRPFESDARPDLKYKGTKLPGDDR